MKRSSPTQVTPRRQRVTKVCVSRRQLLRGIGSVAVALPWLEEMELQAQDQSAPLTRCLTAFFGLGIQKPFLDQRFTGPLQPLQEFESRIALFTNAQMQQAGGGGAHCESAPVVFVGERKVDIERAGGPSIDQLMKTALHPDGVPTAVDTLTSGIWFRNGACVSQRHRVWDSLGAARPPMRRPSKVFETLFGAIVPDPSAPMGPEAALETRIKRSILDGTRDQYQRWASNDGILGAKSREKLDAHLQSIREIERRLSAGDGALPEGCVPARPVEPEAMDYERFTYEIAEAAPEMQLQDFITIWQLHADLWAAALRCDIVRFGNIMHLGAGDHIKLFGTHSGLGEVLDFRSNIDQGTPHFSWFHKGDAQSQGLARLHQHFALSELAYFFRLLNDPMFLEANGKSVLDNTLIVLGTEYGFNHQVTDVFHAILGGNGHFNPGFYDQQMNVIDVYNAALTAYGINHKIGEATQVTEDVIGEIPGLLA